MHIHSNSPILNQAHRLLIIVSQIIVIATHWQQCSWKKFINSSEIIMIIMVNVFGSQYLVKNMLLLDITLNVVSVHTDPEMQFFVDNFWNVFLSNKKSISVSMAHNNKHWKACQLWIANSSNRPNSLLNSETKPSETAQFFVNFSKTRKKRMRCTFQIGIYLIIQAIEMKSRNEIEFSAAPAGSCYNFIKDEWNCYRLNGEVSEKLNFHLEWL